jgi:mitotic spindle assembly checkpoint protein MAD2B
MADHAADSDLIIDILLQFWEVCTHAVLDTLHLYPPDLFEERMQYGLPAMQSRHPDVCRYISKVLENAQPLVAAGLVERLLLQVTLPSGLPAFQVSFAMRLESLHAAMHSGSAQAAPGFASTQTNANIMPPTPNPAAALELQEELRGSLLKMTMSLAHLPALEQDATWSLGLVTLSESTSLQEHPATGTGAGTNNGGGNSNIKASKADTAMAHAMQSGQWIVDNDHLPHVFSAAAAAAAAATDRGVMGVIEKERESGGSGHFSASVGGGRADSDSDRSRVVAIKSFTAAGISSSIYVHVHV